MNSMPNVTKEALQELMIFGVSVSESAQLAEYLVERSKQLGFDEVNRTDMRSMIQEWLTDEYGSRVK